jgi:hypothetical protein
MKTPISIVTSQTGSKIVAEVTRDEYMCYIETTEPLKEAKFTSDSSIQITTVEGIKSILHLKSSFNNPQTRAINYELQRRTTINNS